MMIRGTVFGGRQPISGSSIQVYAIDLAGRNGSNPQIAESVQTDASGAFFISGPYTCPSPDAPVYVVARGGKSSMSSGKGNSSIALMSVVGACKDVGTKPLAINEVTTVGSLWPLAPYAKSVNQIAPLNGDATQFEDALEGIQNLVDATSGTAVSLSAFKSDLATGEEDPSAKLNTLANMMAGCVDSSGGSAGDGSPCGNFFSAASSGLQKAPADTLSAALAVAQHPTENVQKLFDIALNGAVFQPVLRTVPPDLTLPFPTLPLAPLISPLPGNYAAGQLVTMMEPTPQAMIYFTTDGSLPTTSSSLYAGPITLSHPETVRAMAFKNSLRSPTTSAMYNVTTPIAMVVTPGTTMLKAAQAQAFSAIVTGSSNHSVTWTQSPTLGTLSASGVFTAPSSIRDAATVTITATSLADPTKTASAQVSLSPNVAISLLPGNVTLQPSQTQAFSALVVGTTDTSVNWSLSPAVGSISSTGVYSAPPTLTGSQKITVTATSGADSTKTASATISLALPSQAYSTLYVDNTIGNDANDGGSPATAFASIAKVNSLALIPGQTVAFKTDQEWHETIVVAHSGTAGSPITYTSYGGGAQPIISAANTLAGWVQGTGASSLESCGGAYFCSGFEAPAFADWASFANNNDASVSISTLQHNHGNSSMMLSTTTGQDTRAWVTEVLPASVSESTDGVRFYINVPVGSLKPNSSFKVMEVFAGTNDVGFAVMLTDGGGNISQMGVWDGADYTNVVPLTSVSGFTMGAWNEVEIDFTMSATNGGGSLYVNGVQQGQTTSGANTQSWVGLTQIELGNTAYGSALNPGAALFFDDVKIARTNAPIGPFGGGLASNVWYLPQSSDPKLVNFGGQAGTPVPSSGSITAANQFAWDGTNLYVYSISDPTNLVEIPQRNSVMTAPGASYITVSGLELRGGRTYNVYCGGGNTPCDHWDFESNTFNAGYSNELYFQTYPGPSCTPSGPTVHGNVFKGGGSNGIALANAAATGATINNNEFYDLAKIYHIDSTGQNQWSDAIEGYSQTGQDGAGTYVGYNYIHDIGPGNSIGYGGGIHPDTVVGWTIEHNWVQNTNGAGVQLEKGSGHTARYNVIVNGGTHTYGSGLMIRAGEGSSVDNMLAEYNTAVGGWWACNVAVQQDGGNVRATNVTFRKNICVSANSGTQFYSDPGTIDTGNSYTQNNFGTVQPYFVIFNGWYMTGYPAIDSMLSATTGDVQGDPQFVNPAGGNYNLQATSPAIGIGAYPGN